MTQLLQNALYGTALILAAALLRRALKDRLVPEARLALWAACLFRLLTPAAPESVLSLWGLFAKPAPVPVQAAQLYIPAQAAPAPAPQPSAPAFSWDAALGLAWLAVGLALAARYALSWRRTRRAVASAIPLERDDPRYAPLPKCARLREGVMEGAPLTFGVARPTVVLSPGLAGEELACVLAHEGVHASRRDNLWHYAMALVLAVHWWNPAVWLMARLLRRDIELACDRAALKRLGMDKRGDYARALVSLATQDSGPAFCQTFGRKAAEERILSVMKFKKTSVIGVIFSLTLVLAITVAFASEPKADAAVQFHGQTFSRSELSQGTLDWLDWYLALSDEEQLAVNYVPAELNPGRDAGTQDAYSSEKVGGTTTASLPDGVLAYAKGLSVGMSRESVHALLGEPSFSMSRPYSETYELDPDTHEPQLGIFYDVDGTVTQVKYFSSAEPGSTVIDLTPYLSSSAPPVVSIPDIEATKGIQSGFPEVDPDDVDLSEIKKMLDKKVADGEITQEEADQRLAATEEILEQARRGELKLFWYDSGGESWFYGMGVFQVNGETQSRFVDPGQILQPLYYEDGNGKLVHVDPDTVANGYVLVSDTPYVEEEGEDISGMIGSLLGEADIKYDEGKTVTDFDVKLPTFDEDGNPVNNGVIGSRFYSYQVQSSDGVAGGGAVRTSSGTYTLCTAKDCNVLYDHCHIDGKVVRVYQEDPGLLCARPDCTNGEPHEHDGVRYAGKAPEAYVILEPEMEPVPSAAPASGGRR